MVVLWFVALMSWGYLMNVSCAGAAMEAVRPPVLIPLRGKLEMPLSEVEWKREGELLARISRGRCDYGCGNTSQLFSNGSLWLSHGGKEEEGRYSVTVYDAEERPVHQVNITLRVIEIPEEQVLGPGNTSVLLPLDSEPHLVRVDWWRGERILGKVYRDICIIGCDEEYTMFPNGSFLLRRFQREDEGRYSADVYNTEDMVIHHQTEILIYIYDSHTETLPGRLSKSRLPNPAIILIIEGAIFFLVVVVSIAYMGNVLCKRRKRKSSDEVNIQLPLSAVTMQDAGTESEGMDGTRTPRIYRSLEELTTFISRDRRDV
ncbi:uncharacterized protein ACMZJ9_000999 [Mantella aurantiaca]